VPNAVKAEVMIDTTALISARWVRSLTAIFPGQIDAQGDHDHGDDGNDPGEPDHGP
jgi:hypothetical protein